MDKEVRTYTVKMEARDDSPKLVGHSAVFNEEADIGGLFRERIEPGAFAESIKNDDIRALFNHDPNHVLGRNTAGTLSLREDTDGLMVEIDPPDTQFARDLGVSIGRGDITQQSFGFQVLEEEWSFAEEKGEMDVRTISKAKLFDVSPVTFPAYEGTDIAVRSHEAALEERKKSATPWKRNLRKRKLDLITKDNSKQTP